MEYIHCLWIHTFSDEPVILVSELDDVRNEIRKIEMWRNGEFGWADKTGGTRSELSVLPLPSLQEINSGSEFSAMKIDPQDFENFWKLARLKG